MAASDLTKELWLNLCFAKTKNRYFAGDRVEPILCLFARALRIMHCRCWLTFNPVCVAEHAIGRVVPVAVDDRRLELRRLRHDGRRRVALVRRRDGNDGHHRRRQGRQRLPHARRALVAARKIGAVQQRERP